MWRDRVLDTARAFPTSGTAMMERFYREMGQPRRRRTDAAQAGFTTIYRPSGETAMSLRIATSLDEPPQ
jgi:hypothetical protein